MINIIYVATAGKASRLSSYIYIQFNIAYTYGNGNGVIHQVLCHSVYVPYDIIRSCITLHISPSRLFGREVQVL